MEVSTEKDYLIESILSDLRTRSITHLREIAQAHHLSTRQGQTKNEPIIRCVKSLQKYSIPQLVWAEKLIKMSVAYTPQELESVYLALSTDLDGR